MSSEGHTVFLTVTFTLHPGQWMTVQTERPREVWKYANIHYPHRSQTAGGSSSSYLSFSMGRKAGRMFRKLLLRSSLGWLLVRLMEPFSLRLRNPCGGWEEERKRLKHQWLLQENEKYIQVAPLRVEFTCTILLTLICVNWRTKGCNVRNS